MSGYLILNIRVSKIDLNLTHAPLLTNFLLLLTIQSPLRLQKSRLSLLRRIGQSGCYLS